jgi:prepilin-type N-terminal cleavage/methylation domain-containing protein
MKETLQRLNERRKQDEGFTLIELLVVIVILGILAAVVVFAVGGITDRGAESACEATAKSVETASEAYYAQNTAYAANLGDLDPQFVRLDTDIWAGGVANTLTTDGGTITYTAGAVTEACA